MTRRAMVVAATSLALCAGGCGSESDGGGGGGTGGTDGTGGSHCAVGSGCNDRPAVVLDDVSGTWALLEVETTVVSSSYMEDFDTVVVSLLLLEQTQTGSDVSAEAVWCDRFACTEASVRSVLPANFASLLPGFTWTGTYTTDTDGAGHYVLPPYYWTQGAVLADPTDSSTLPTTPDDPTVVDQDSDGNPGMTVSLTGSMDGAVYVVQWNSESLDGRPTSVDTIEGLMTSATHQNVIGSDPEWIQNVIEQPVPDSDPCVTYFVMVRVADGTDCAGIVADRAALFPSAPTNG